MGGGGGQKESVDSISSWPALARDWQVAHGGNISTTGTAAGLGPSLFHCDRSPYSMVSKRRLCGARRRTIELLPPLSAQTKWVAPLLEHPGRHGARHHQQAGTNNQPAHYDEEPTMASEPGSSAPINSLGGLGGERSLVLEEEENLGAYLIDGSYGRLASELAQQRQRHAAAPPSGQVASSWRRHSRQRLVAREAGTGRSAAASSSPQPPNFLSNGPSASSGSLGLLEPSTIYRDQIYHFDGAIDALPVPSALYQQPASHDAAAAPAAAADFLFGANHTLSFWMRHQPFRFKHRQSSNATADATYEELRRHVREHILCSTLLPPPPLGATNLSSNAHRAGPHQRQQQQRQRRKSLYRHAIYLKNCQLIVSMVGERVGLEADGDLDLGSLRPPSSVEWRWLPGDADRAETNQLCDNKWHLYSLNVNYPQAELFIDGQQFAPTWSSSSLRNNARGAGQLKRPLTIDRRGNSISAAAISNGRAEEHKLTIGACWQTHSRSMFGHFRGALSGLNVVMNSNDDTGSIECLGRCMEALVSLAPQNDQQQQQQQPSGSLQADSSLVSYQDSQDRILLQGHDLFDIEDALAQIAYINKRRLPSVGRRTIAMDTTVTCAHSANHAHNQQQQHHHSSGFTESSTASTDATGKQVIAIEPLSIELNVLPSTSLPAIVISGTSNLAREYAPFIQGKVAPFESLRLRVKQLDLVTGKFVPTSTADGKDSDENTDADANKQFGATNSSSSTTASPPDVATFGPGGDSLDYIDDSTTTTGQLQGKENAALSVNRELSENLSSCKRRIEACHIGFEPALNGAHETIELPVGQIDSLALYWRQNSEGALIYGLDWAENYEQLLRAIVYKNQVPHLYSERHFKLKCSDMSGRLVSNEHLQTITIIHPRRPAATTAATTATTVDDESATDVRINRSEAVPAQASYYSALKHSADPVLKYLHTGGGGYMDTRELAGGDQLHPDEAGLMQQQDTKLNRLAMAFLVFVISLMVIMLVIALTNLRESAGDATKSCKKKKKKHQRARRAKRSAAADSDDLGDEDESELAEMTTRPSYACVDFVRADSYFAQNEEGESAEEDDEDDDVEDEEDDEEEEEERDDDDDYRNREEDEDDMEAIGQRDEDIGARFYERYARFGCPLKSDTRAKRSHRCALATDRAGSITCDEDYDCEHDDEQQQEESGSGTTIIVNPIVHGLADVRAMHDRHDAGADELCSLVARLDRPGNDNDARPKSHLSNQSVVALDDINEPTDSATNRLRRRKDSKLTTSRMKRSGSQGQGNNSEYSQDDDDNDDDNDVDSVNDDDDDNNDDLIEMDDDMLTSVCSRSRSCSASSISSSQSVSTIASQHEATTRQPQQQLVHHHHFHHQHFAHLHHQSRQHQRHIAPPHAETNRTPTVGCKHYECVYDNEREHDTGDDSESYYPIGQPCGGSRQKMRAPSQRLVDLGQLQQQHQPSYEIHHKHQHQCLRARRAQSDNANGSSC